MINAHFPSYSDELRMYAVEYDDSFIIESASESNKLHYHRWNKNTLYNDIAIVGAVQHKLVLSISLNIHLSYNSELL